MSEPSVHRGQAPSTSQGKLIIYRSLTVQGSNGPQICFPHPSLLPDSIRESQSGNITGVGGRGEAEGRNFGVSSALKGSLPAVILPTEGIRNLLSSEVLGIDYLFEKYLLSSYYV